MDIMIVADMITFLAYDKRFGLFYRTCKGRTQNEPKRNNIYSSHNTE